MIWKLGPSSHRGDELLSYIIAKHPENVFERAAGPGRKVVGKFSEDIIPFKTFSGHVENDSLDFLQTARKMNMSNYVHTQLAGVCPHNLKGFDVCFRSSLRGNNAGGISDVEFWDELPLWMSIGPYPNKFEQLKYWFENAGFQVEDSVPGFDAHIVGLTTDGMNVTELLQKVFIISHYLTKKFGLRQVEDAQITKFIDLCTGWLEKMENRHRIVNGLCGYRRDKIAEFETAILDNNGTVVEEEEVERRHTHIERLLEKKNFHTMRHDICAASIPDDAKTFLELGCGGGRLLRFIRKVRRDLKIVGLEKNSRAVMKASRRRRGLSVIHSDILWPSVRDSDLMPDFLACTEVIEHLTKEDRTRIIQLLMKVYLPKAMVITVPNIEYNKFIDALEPGELRHPDHKIEFTKDELIAEIVEPLSEMYTIGFKDIKTEEGITPSWILVAVHKDPDSREIDQRWMERIKERYAPIYLPETNYLLRKKELAAGFASHAHQLNGENIFYIGPTMSPVDWVSLDMREEAIDPGPFLEHPCAAFEYYRNRGITTIYGEEKMMGSRASILVFSDDKTAELMGFDQPWVVLSRGGFPFFREGEEEKFEPIGKVIQSRLERGAFVILDAEITPWSYKAGGLITHEFKIPGECVFLSRKYGQYGDSGAAREYLNALASYSGDGPITIHPFSVLATGALEVRPGKKPGSTFTKVNNVTNGMFMPRWWHYGVLSNFAAKFIEPIEHHEVDLSSEQSMRKSVQMWERFCEDKNGEGFVYKIPEAMTFTRNGFPIQPCLKVRGRNYLRIIYGVDYLSPDYFRKVTHRNTKAKRVQAAQQHVLGVNVLRAFLNRNKNQHQRFVAGFLGAESINMGNVDATL